MKKLIISLLLIWFCHLSNVLAAVTAQLEQTQVAVGDNFRVTFTINDNATNVVPDLTPLQQNFEILGTSKSTQISIINGNNTMSTTWGVTLSAKNTGTLTIPALTFGNDKSNPLKLQVTQTSTPTQTRGANAKVFLEATVDNQHPYIQSQVLYKVKLLYSQRLSSGAIRPPAAAQAVIIKIGDSRQSQQQKDGVLYQVLEQNYVIFPQQRGQLKISPPVFNGSVTENQAQDFDQLLFAVQRPLQAQARPINLQVAAIPPSFTGKQWIPARNLTLSESWQGIQQTPQVGQPLTREIVIQAQGLTAAQLPDLPASSIAGVNSYLDKTKIHNTKSQDTILGERRVTITYIPTQTGTINLPEIKLPWWNTQTNQQQIATLPAHKITIFPALAKPTTQTPTPSPITNNKPSIIPTTQPTTSTAALLPWIIAISFIGLWLITLLIWRFSLKKAANPLLSSTNNHDCLDKKSWLRQFEHACKDNQPKLAQHALLNLVRVYWPSHIFANLGDLEKLYQDQKLKSALAKLNAAIYAESTQPWNGMELWQAWQNIEEYKFKENKIKSVLPSLYPQ